MPRPPAFGVRVSADHKTTRECIVLKNDLMNNATSRFPETNAIFGCAGGQEVVDFLVCVDSSLEILNTLDLSFDQMITMYCCRNCDGW